MERQRTFSGIAAADPKFIACIILGWPMTELEYVVNEKALYPCHPKQTKDGRFQMLRNQQQKPMLRAFDTLRKHCTVCTAN
jgi:hypothetical protein